MIRALAMTAALLLAAGCGQPGPVKCTTANCSGCCSPDGECVGAPAQSPQACGRGGSACRVCLPQQACAAGACVTNADASIPFDDAGAAPGPGGMDASVACGGEGEACCANLTCALPLTCQRGACQRPGAVTDAGACGRLGQPCCGGQQCTEVGARCDGASCVAATADAGVDAGAALRGLGEACTADAQCRDGACLVLGFSGGSCTKGCATATDCPAGSQCGPNTSGVGPAKICYRQCSAAGQAPGGCRAGYVCEANAGTAGVPICYPACQSAATCGLAPTCDARGFCCGADGFVCCDGSTCQAGSACMSGTCRTAAVVCGGAGQACCTSGAACTGQQVCAGSTCAACGAASQPCCDGNVCSDGVCTAGTCQPRVVSGVGGPCADYVTDCGSTLDVCITQSGTQWQGGYCSKVCSQLSCPPGSSCTTYLSTTTSYCLQDCAWDGGAGGCRAGYVCDRQLIASDPSRASCFPRCTTGPECSTGRCEAGFCCGGAGYRCCATGAACPTGRACVAGYCQ